MFVVATFVKLYFVIVFCSAGHIQNTTLLTYKPYELLVHLVIFKIQCYLIRGRHLSSD